MYDIQATIYAWAAASTTKRYMYGIEIKLDQTWMLSTMGKKVHTLSTLSILEFRIVILK